MSNQQHLEIINRLKRIERKLHQLDLRKKLFGYYDGDDYYVSVERPLKRREFDDLNVD